MRTEHLINFDRRQGVTLVEMLTVVGLMMFLVAIAVPAFNVNNQEKQIVNAARSLQAYITEARAKAISSGRPCGVAFIPYESFPEACVRVQLVETPPVFCGYETNATCTVTKSGDTPKVEGIPKEWNIAGNKIRFGGRGQWYRLKSGGVFEPVNNPDNSNKDFRPWSSTAPSAGSWKTTYEIQAAPIAEAQNYLQAIGMAAPLKFPRGICVDLFYSGCGDVDAFGKQPQPVYIMFSPTGQLESYYFNKMSKLPEGKLYFMMGKWDKAIREITPENKDPDDEDNDPDDEDNDPDDEDKDRNYQDYDCCWVIIDPELGTVSVQPIIDNSSVSSSRTVTKKDN